MPSATLELNARNETVSQPIIWRLGKLYNVVTNIVRARVSDDFGYVTLTLEGTADEINDAQRYLASLGLIPGQRDATLVVGRSIETKISQPNTIYVTLETVNAAQGHSSTLFRVGKDYNLVVNIERAAFDDEEGGTVEITLSGVLTEVQRAIAYLHTTGLHVNPRQRSVTDFGNL